MKRILTIVMAMILAVSVVGLAGCKKEEEKKDGGLGNAKEGKLVVGLDDTFHLWALEIRKINWWALI